MALITTGSVMSSGALAKFVEKAAFDQFVADLYFMQMGDKRVLAKGFNDYSFNFIDQNSLTAAAAVLTEGVTPAESDFTISQTTVTMQQLGTFVSMSDIVMDDTMVSVMEKAAIELGRRMAEIVDETIQTELLNGTNVIYAGVATSTATLVASETLTAELMANARRILKANSAPDFGGSYVMVIHPDVEYDLLVQASGAGAFIEISKYDNSEAILKGEIGRIFGVRVVVSPNCSILADAGAALVDVYPCFVMGSEAYAVVMAQNLGTIVKPLGSEGSLDPLNQRATVGSKIRFGTKVLRDESLVRIEVAAAEGVNV